MASYLSFGVSVNYMTVDESPSLFPAITVCNLNPFDFSNTNFNKTYFNMILNINNLSSSVSLSDGAEAYSTVNNISTLIKAYITRYLFLCIQYRKLS